MLLKRFSIKIISKFLIMENTKTNTFDDYKANFRLFNARRGLAEWTLNYYEEYMRRFFEYTGAKIEDFKNKKDLLHKYEQLFQIESIKNETRKKHLKTLRIFSDFLEENEIIENNFSRKIKPPRVPKILPKPLEDEEINKIFESINEIFTGFLAERNTMIIKTFLNTGVRLSELINLKQTDISQDKIFIKNGKWAKDRYIYISENFSQELHDFCKKYPHGYIFYGQQFKKKLGETGLKRLFEKLKEYTKIENLHAHRLRHTYATKIIEKWVDIGVLKEQMGHADISTTNKYIAVSNAHRKKVMEVLDMF